MRRFMLLIIALAIFLPTLAQAYDVLVLQSRREPMSDAVLQSFTAASGYSQRLIVMNDYAEVDAVRLVREDHPRLVLALGDSAVEAARSIRQTPVLALLSLKVHNRLPNNMTAITLFTPPERYMELFSSLGLKRIGLLYDETKTDWYLQKARAAAKRKGIVLVPKKISSPKQVLLALAEIAPDVDGLWMLPDSTAVYHMSVESWFVTGMGRNLPVISFAEHFLGKGASAVLAPDLTDLGRQAAETASSIIKGADYDGPIWPRTTPVKTNPAVLRKIAEWSKRP